MKIEKNIPMPSPRKKAPDTDYPFDKMEIGDSIGITLEQRERCRIAVTYYNRANRLKGIRLSMLRYQGAYRIWRIS